MAVDQAFVMQSYRNAVQQMSAVENMWNPFQIVYVRQNGVEVNQWSSFITSMVNIGILILLLMASLRLVSILWDELHNIPASTAFLGVVLEIAFVGVCLWNYTWFAEIFPGLFHRLTQAVLAAYGNDIMKDAANAVGVAALEKTTENKWFSLNFSLSSIPQAISNIIGVLALAMTWVVSIYQAALYTLWYLIGPILIPFFIFKPFRGVAVRWFRSLLAVSFMGVVGSILFLLIQRSGWMMQSFAAGHNSSYVTSLVFSTVCLLLMFSVPALSTAIFSGIEANISQSAFATSILGRSAVQATTSTAKATVGSASVATGQAFDAVGGVVGALGRYRSTAGSGMSGSDRVLDAVRNRNEIRSPGGLLDMVQASGQALKYGGMQMIANQLPGPLNALGRLAFTPKGIKEARSAFNERRLHDHLKARVKSEFGNEAANSMNFEGMDLRVRDNESFAQASNRLYSSAAKPFERGRENIDGSKAINKRLSETFGEDAGKAFPSEGIPFSKRAGESFDAAVDRQYEMTAKKWANTQDAKDIRDYIAKHHGEDEAQKVFISPNRNWNLPKDGTRIDQIAQHARHAVNNNRLMSDVSDVRKAAEGFVGTERASKIDWSNVRALKDLKPNENRQAAIDNYAMTLLYRARAFTPEETKMHDHAAMRKEIERKLGPEKAAKVAIPDEWRVTAKRGQARADAIKGSTVALLQQQGLIDRLGQTGAGSVSDRHSVRSRDRNKKNRPTKPSEGNA